MQTVPIDGGLVGAALTLFAEYLPTVQPSNGRMGVSSGGNTRAGCADVCEERYRGINASQDGSSQQTAAQTSVEEHAHG